VDQWPFKPAYYSDYATYFVKWIKAFAEFGIHITAITPQNEPLNRGNSASLFMGWTEQRDFVKILGPKMVEAGWTQKFMCSTITTITIT
jgi:glucosylceramidase